MNKPDATRHRPEPAYLRELLAQARISQRGAAEQLGMSAAGLQNYLRDPVDPKYRPAPYVVQFALEALAKYGRGDREQPTPSTMERNPAMTDPKATVLALDRYTLASLNEYAEAKAELADIVNALESPGPEVLEAALEKVMGCARALADQVLAVRERQASGR